MNFEGHEDLDHIDPNAALNGRPLSEQELIELIEKNTGALQEESEVELHSKIKEPLSNQGLIQSQNTQEVQEQSTQKRIRQHQQNEKQVGTSNFGKRLPDQIDSFSSSELPQSKRQNTDSDGQINDGRITNQSFIDKRETDKGTHEEDFSRLLEMNDTEQLRFLTRHLRSDRQGGISDEVRDGEEKQIMNEMQGSSKGQEAQGMEENERPASKPLIETISTRESTAPPIINPDSSTSSTLGHESMVPASTHDYEDSMNGEAIFVKQESTKASEDGRIILRSRTLPILENLASQLLDILVGKKAYQDTLNIITQPDSSRGIAFQILLDLFQKTKQIYCEDGQQFLTTNIPGLESNRVNKSMVQRANMATFLAAVFGSIEVGFYHLNKYFLQTFVSDNGRLLKPQAGLYLDLKTQAYISALSQGEKSKSEVLDDLFPDDLEQILFSYRPDRNSLSPSEMDFIARCKRRRNRLEEEESAENLVETYQWLSFLKDLTEYVGKAYDQLISPINGSDNNFSILHNTTATSAVGSVRSADSTTSTNQQNSHSYNQHHHQNISSSKPHHPNVQVWNSNEIKTNNEGKSSFAEGSNSTIQSTSGVADASPAFASDTLTAYRSARRMLSMSSSWASAASSSSVGADSRSEYSAGVVGKPSNLMFTRRPWTAEEEEALVNGLDRVEGPYWSQILELYGPGGSVSEVLKDRNQVQLKDKARNLKMFFLKCGLPVPAVFQYVTGDINARNQTTKKRKERKKGGGGESTPENSHQGASSTASQPNTPILVPSTPPIIATTSSPVGVDSAVPLSQEPVDPSRTLPVRSDSAVDPILTSHFNDPPSSSRPLPASAIRKNGISKDSDAEGRKGSVSIRNLDSSGTDIQSPTLNQDFVAVENNANSSNIDSGHHAEDTEDAGQLERLLQRVGDYIAEGQIEGGRVNREEGE